MTEWGFETRQIHAGAAPDPPTNARATPIYQTTSYVFRDTDHASALFGLSELGNIYTRIMNPTQNPFEERMSWLEGGTYNLFPYTFPKLGIETTFVENPDDLEEWAAAVRPNTKAFFAETLGNPKGDVLNFEGVSKVAHDNKITVVID